MKKFGNVVLDESQVMEAHVGKTGKYIKVTFKNGAQVTYNETVLGTDPRNVLYILQEAMLESTTPTEEPKKEEKLGIKDVLMMNAMQQMMNPGK